MTHAVLSHILADTTLARALRVSLAADWLEDNGHPRLAEELRQPALGDPLVHAADRLHMDGLLAWSAYLDCCFVQVPPGTFWMGGGGGKAGEQEITIAQEFQMAVYPVTQGEWQAIMGANPSHFSRNGKGKEKVAGIADGDLARFPVECVSWDDVQEFLRKLNEGERNREWLYRLPTSAEWEYACRGAPVSKEECSFHFYFDQPTNDLSSHEANFDGNRPDGKASEGPYLGRTSRVGSYRPNRLGTHDMHGNVWEWCQDARGSSRMHRGGSWNFNGNLCRAGNRLSNVPGYRLHLLGFRLARSVPSDSK